MSETNLALQSCKIIVHRARNLIVKGRDNTNSSYAVICSGKEKFQTAVVDKTLFPQWNEECILYVYKPNSSVDIIIYNRGLVLDDLIGQVTIPLSSVKEDGKPVRSWYKLEGKSAKSKKERGDVEITIQVKGGLNPYAPIHSWNMAKMKQTHGDIKEDKTQDQKKEKQSLTQSNVRTQQEMKQSVPAPQSVPTSDPKFVKKNPLYGSANDLSKPPKTPPTQRRRLAKYAPAHRRLSMPYTNIDPNAASPAMKSSYHVNQNLGPKSATNTSEESGELDDPGNIANRRRSSSESMVYRSYQTLPHRKSLKSVEEETDKHVQRDAKFRHSFHSSDQPSAVLSIPAKNNQDPQPEPSKISSTDLPDNQESHSTKKTPPVKPPRSSPTRSSPTKTPPMVSKHGTHSPTTSTSQPKPDEPSPTRSAEYGRDSTDSVVTQPKIEETKTTQSTPYNKTRTPSPNEGYKTDLSSTPSPVEPKPVIINIDDSISSGYSRAPARPHRKTKAVSTPMARFENMSKEDLAMKVLDLEEQLHQQSKSLRETQDYLNTLLLRVIVQNPSLLNRDLEIEY